jgi:hypothetical protein
MDQSHLTKPGKVQFYTIFEIRRNFRRGEAYFTSSFTIDVVAVLVQSASNICIPSFTRMVSSVDIAKRMLVTLLKSLAGIYGVVLGLTRESTDTQVKAAYKQVSRRAHPDQGGEVGEGFCKKKLQQSLDRGFFYVWANKVGTVRGADGKILVAGNYEPAWTKARCRQAHDRSSEASAWEACWTTPLAL